MRILLAILGIAALVATLANAQATGTQKEEPRATPYMRPEGYEVYAALLPMDGLWAGSDLLVIRNETQMARGERTPGDTCTPSKELTKPWTEAWNDYKQQNASRYILSSDILIKKRYVLKSADEIKDAIQTPVDLPHPEWRRGLEGFFVAFPGARGYIVLSAVGFSTSKTKAVVYMEYYCGSLCAGGSYYFLEKGDDGRWVLADKNEPRMMCMSWVS